MCIKNEDEVFYTLRILQDVVYDRMRWAVPS